jgi:phosphoribosyl 1,2-cyclic phosphodiesterase
MHLIFLGTRGGIKARSQLHHMHSSLLLTHKTTRIIIDRGEDWLHYPFPPADALLISHAHPDHVGGLARGCPYPVYASKATWTLIKRYPIKDRIILSPYTPFFLGPLTITPFPVNHSLKAPALGYRITNDQHSLFYVPDLASIQHEHQALSHLDLYIGDGAIVTRTMLLRKKDHTLTGHAPISHQLAWCQKYHVPRAIFTHCGSEITNSDPAAIEARINTLAHKYQVPTTIAYDGMTLTL